VRGDFFTVRRRLEHTFDILEGPLMNRFFISAIVVTVVIPAMGSPNVDVDMNAVIQSNAKVKNIDGSFTITKIGYYWPEKIDKLRTTFSESINHIEDPKTRASIEKQHKLILEEISQNGKYENRYSFNGVLTSEGFFSFDCQSDAGRKYNTVANREKTMVYSKGRKEGEIYWSGDTGTPVHNTRVLLDNVVDWMSANSIKAGDDTVSVEKRDRFFNDEDALVIERGFKDIYKGLTKKHTVIPSYGFLAVGIESVKNGKTIIKIESQNIAEISPSIWKPMKRVKTYYDEDGQVDSEVIVEFVESPQINIAVDESSFNTVFPQEVTHIQDHTTGSAPLTIDLAKEDAFQSGWSGGNRQSTGTDVSGDASHCERR
jgi:hypothetical protein